MKKLILTTLIASSIVGTAAVQAAPVDSSLEKDMINICVALKSDNSLTLNRAIKQSRLNYNAVANGLKCNGVDAINFAIQNDANETASLLSKKANVDAGVLVAKN